MNRSFRLNRSPLPKELNFTICATIKDTVNGLWLKGENMSGKSELAKAEKFVRLEGDEMKNELAFPRTGDKNIESWQSGMTLRDYFAAKAMQGMIACGHTKWELPSNKVIAETAYSMADSMLLERERVKNET